MNGHHKNIKRQPAYEISATIYHNERSYTRVTQVLLLSSINYAKPSQGRVALETQHQRNIWIKLTKLPQPNTKQIFCLAIYWHVYGMSKGIKSRKNVDPTCIEKYRRRIRRFKISDDSSKLGGLLNSYVSYRSSNFHFSMRFWTDRKSDDSKSSKCTIYKV